jgi:signal transduction histidine kinase
MGHQTFKILLIEDNPGDARLIKEFLSETNGAAFELDSVDRLSEGLVRLDGKDAVLLDLALPDSTGIDTFRKLHSEAPFLPIIVLTGNEDDALAFKAVQEGAQDFLIKGQANSQLLARSMRYAIERKRIDSALKAEILKHEQLEEELHLAKEELEVANEELRLELDHHQRLEIALSHAKEELEVANEELQVELEHHRKLEAELVAAKDAAEDAAEAKAAFLANMSHELRTPMNSVMGYTSILLEEDISEDLKDYVEGIRSGGESLLSLINNILDFSRAEKRKVELERQPIRLKGCIHESLEMVAVQAKEKGLSLSYAIGYRTPDTILGDHGRLRQILVNLLSNAVKFTDAGDVTVSVSSEVIEGKCHQILFAVKDTGIGIPKNKMDELFQPFGQVERIISRKRDGVGLGLAISSKLVELMGGRIWAESVPGSGTIFRFTIRAEAVSAKGQDLEEDRLDVALEGLPDQKPLRVLVAEDNPSNQKVLMLMLKRMGYRPDAVADGREVLQALERQPYDLVLMDVKMPEMDGITAAQVIRRLWPNSSPKIVAITAYALEGDREKCLEAGMDDYISKPVQKKDLEATLMKYSSS